VAGNHVNQFTRAFEVVPPGTECLQDSEKLLVMCIVIELGSLQHPGEFDHHQEVLKELP